MVFEYCLGRKPVDLPTDSGLFVNDGVRRCAPRSRVASGAGTPLHLAPRTAGGGARASAQIQQSLRRRRPRRRRWCPAGGPTVSKVDMSAN